MYSEPDYYCEYHYKVFCVLGDPSLHVWKDVPMAVNVAHETSINVGSNELEYTVTFVSNGQPVENAEVCLTGKKFLKQLPQMLQVRLILISCLMMLRP